MTDAIKVSVIDHVTGVCPPCKHAAITVVPDSCVHDGYGNLKEQVFTLCCKHEAVCNLRTSGGEMMPTEVEIVRCTDCRFYEKGDSGYWCKKSITLVPEKSGFCAWGEQNA